MYLDKLLGSINSRVFLEVTEVFRDGSEEVTAYKSWADDNCYYNAVQSIGKDFELEAIEYFDRWDEKGGCMVVDITI